MKVEYKVRLGTFTTVFVTVETGYSASTSELQQIALDTLEEQGYPVEDIWSIIPLSFTN